MRVKAHVRAGGAARCTGVIHPPIHAYRTITVPEHKRYGGGPPAPLHLGVKAQRVVLFASLRC